MRAPCKRVVVPVLQIDGMNGDKSCVRKCQPVPQQCTQSLRDSNPSSSFVCAQPALLGDVLRMHKQHGRPDL